MLKKMRFYKKILVGIFVFTLVWLVTGCEPPVKQADLSKQNTAKQLTIADKEVAANIESTPQATSLKTAYTDKTQPQSRQTSKDDQQLTISPENATVFEKMHIVEVICEPRSDIKTDPNTPQTNVNNDWCVKIDGQTSPLYDGIGELAFTLKVDHIAYAAKKGSKFHLVVDGNDVNPEYDDIEDIIFSPDGNRLAYKARIGDEWIVVLDGQAGPKYDFINYLAFSPDGRRFAYSAGKENGKKQTVVLDGVEICPPYDVTRTLVFSNDSKRMAFMAEDDSKRFVVVDGKPDEKYDMTSEPVFSHDSKSYAYFAKKENYKFLVLDGVAGTPFMVLSERDVPVFGPNDNRVAFRAGLDENLFVVVNDYIGPFFDGIGDNSIVLSADGKSHAYTAQKGEQWCVVVNDHNGPFYDGITANGPVFSPDGKHFAYGALLNGRFFMVFDHQPLPGYDNYDEIGRNSISFSPDGKHLIYKALKNQKWYMVVDGLLGPAYDKLLFEPTVTENAVEYLAQRDGWAFRCKRMFQQAAADVNNPLVYEQRLMLLENPQTNQQVVYISNNLMIVYRACSQEKSNNLVLVFGGTFRNKESKYYGKGVIVPNFYIGKYEVTQKEWFEIMGTNPSKFIANDLPVEMVNWYECIEYCNKRSIKEGLKPYYNIDKNNKDPNNNNDDDRIKWTVTINPGADGYRLPTEVEWEYAAGGGQMSKNYKYSGSNFIDEVAWYWRNSGDKFQTGFWFRSVIENNNNTTKSVGIKKPNELGLYDMSGNVREWCWDFYKGSGPDDPNGRVWKGGGWLGSEFCCETSFQGGSPAHNRYPDTGFRVCRSK